MSSHRCEADGHTFRRTCALSGLDENLRLNNDFWRLAEALKSGGLPHN